MSKLQTLGTILVSATVGGVLSALLVTKAPTPRRAVPALASGRAEVSAASDNSGPASAGVAAASAGFDSQPELQNAPTANPQTGEGNEGRVLRVEQPTAPRDDRDQYAFAAALAAAEESDEPDAALGQLKKGWAHRRYSWEFRYLAPLCPSNQRCAVLPFDHKRSKTPIVRGFLPELMLSKPAFAQLKQACAEQPRCVVRVSAVLSTLDVSTAEPIALGLTDVRVESARAASDSEDWVRRRRS